MNEAAVTAMLESTRNFKMVLRRDFMVAHEAALLIALIAVVTPGDIVAGQDASKPSLASRPSPNFSAQPRFVPQPNVEHYAPYSVTIEAKGNSNDGVPLVTGIVNSRVPSASVTLSVRVEPDAPGNTVVHWSSPDGKNELGSDFHVVGSSDLKWDEPLLGNAVGVFPHGEASGKAIIVAEVGPPVNARATISIVDGIGIGFGCYGFMPQGQSVRFVDGNPEGIDAFRRRCCSHRTRSDRRSSRRFEGVARTGPLVWVLGRKRRRSRA